MKQSALLRIVLVSLHIAAQCDALQDVYGHGEIQDNCHWTHHELKIQCPLNEGDFSWLDCVGKNIDIDTPRATRFQCSKAGHLYLSWDITPWDTSGRIQDYYVVMGAAGAFCSDPMRHDDHSSTPSRKNLFWWEARNHTSMPMCISSETTEENNRCLLSGAQMFIPYGYGPGCVLLYCDNMWDACGLNMEISIDSKAWIESRNDSIRPFAKRLAINGAGFDMVCSRNEIKCFDARGVELGCYCHSVERGSMAIGLHQHLQPENAGELSVSIKVRGLPPIEKVVVGMVDFVDYTSYQSALWTEVALLSMGLLAGVTCWVMFQMKRWTQNKADERAVFRAEHNPNLFN